MAFPTGSSRIILSSESFQHTHSASGGVRDFSGLDQAVDLASRPSDDPNYEWVDPRVLDILTCFKGSTALDDFLFEASILRPDAPLDAVVDDSCNHTV